MVRTVTLQLHVCSPRPPPQVQEMALVYCIGMRILDRSGAGEENSSLFCSH